MTRLEKYDVFSQFHVQVKELFTEINTNYKPHFDLRNSYGFYIAPGSCMGGQNPTIVEVVYGNRAYRSATRVMNGHETYEAEIAYGTRLCYKQIDTGDILTILYPATTKTHKALEEYFIIDFIKKPKKLLTKKYLTKHFKFMVSYLAVTSVENRPKLIDRIRVFYLRMFKIYSKENTTHEPKIKKYLKKGIIQILIVGFSGFLLAFLPLFINLNRNKQLEKQIETLIENQNKIILLLDTMLEKHDSENYILYLEDIKKEIEKTNDNQRRKNDE